MFGASPKLPRKTSADAVLEQSSKRRILPFGAQRFIEGDAHAALENFNDEAAGKIEDLPLPHVPLKSLS